MIERFFLWLADKQLEHEATPINEKVVRRSTVYLGVLVVSIVVMALPWWQGLPWLILRLVAGMIVGGYSINGLLGTMVRREAYARGYEQGRRDATVQAVRTSLN